MIDSHILPPEVAALLARQEKYRRRLARLSFEEKIAIIERMRELKTWRKLGECSHIVTPAADDFQN